MENHVTPESPVSTSTQESTEQETQSTVETPSTETQPKTQSTQEVTESVSQESTDTEAKTVEVVSRKDSNTKAVKGGDKKVAKDNIVSVTKSTLKLKQTDLTEKMKAKGEEIGVTVKITRGRLSNMCNGNCNVTEQAEKVCTALLADAGYTVTEKKVEETPTATAVA